MSVSKFNLTNCDVQPVSNYHQAVDGNFSVSSRIAANFAPHVSDPAGMSVVIDSGHLMVGANLYEVAAQTVAGIVAATAYPRIDRVVIDRATGAALILTGTESAAPTPPAFPAGVVPVAQIAVGVGTTEITNADLVDERDFSLLGQQGGSLLNVQVFSVAGTYTYTPTLGTASVIVELVGGGGSGGGCEAPPAGKAAAGGGGGAGAYAKGRFTSGFAGVTVTVGAGVPAGAAGAAGVTGNASSFGTLISAQGGTAGRLGLAATPPAATVGSIIAGLPTGGNIVSAGGDGGGYGLVLGVNTVLGGEGGNSIFGAGSSGSTNNSGSGSATDAYGSGGGGGSSVAGGPARAGGAGNAGRVIVYEYS